MSATNEGGAGGWMLVAAKWTDRTAQVARRAAWLAQQRAQQGLLVHFYHYGIRHALRGMSAEACARHQRERLARLAQAVERQTGFLFGVEAQRRGAGFGAELRERIGQVGLCVVEARRPRELAPRLARTGAHPVLMVRREATRAYRRALLMVDAAAPVAPALAHVGGVAPGAEIVLLAALGREGELRLRRAGAGDDRIDAHVQQQREDALRQLAGVDTAAGLTRIVEHGYAPTLLQYAERRIQPDLLVLPGERTPLWRRLFLRSLVGEALARTDCDILVLPERASS